MNRLQWRHAFAVYYMELAGDYCKGFIESKNPVYVTAFEMGMYPEWCAQLQINVENALKNIGLTGLEKVVMI